MITQFKLYESCSSEFDIGNYVKIKEPKNSIAYQMISKIINVHEGFGCVFFYDFISYNKKNQKFELCKVTSKDVSEDKLRLATQEEIDELLLQLNTDKYNL